MYAMACRNLANYGKVVDVVIIVGIAAIHRLALGLRTANGGITAIRSI